MHYTNTGKKPFNAPYSTMRARILMEHRVKFLKTISNHFFVIKSLEKSLIVYAPLRGFISMKLLEIVFENFMLWEAPKLIYAA